MANITKQFTYPIPNELFGSDDSNGTLVNATYNGPDVLWVFVNDSTNKLDGIPPKVAEEDGADYPAPQGYTKVQVDATTETKLVGIILPELITIDDTQTTIVENLPDNETHEYEYPLDISDAYNRFDITYENGTWNTPYATDLTTWDMIISARNQLLETSDSRIAPDMPDSVKQPWIDYRQKLRDLPTTWAGISPHKIQLPAAPDEL